MSVRARHGLFWACYMAYTATYIARLNLSMASPGLVAASLIDAAQIGILGSVFSVVYACGRLFNGLLSDRVHPWIMICSGLLLVCISNVSLGLFPAFAGMVMLWAVNAYAQSMLWSAILRLLSSVYSSGEVKRKVSYMVTAVAAGNIIGIIVNSAVISRLGLAWAFFVPGGIGLFTGVLVYFTARRVELMACEGGSSRAERLLGSSEFRIMLIPALLHGVMKDNISLWMAVYVIDRFGIRLDESAYYVLLIPIIGFIGRLSCPLCYKLSRNNERPVLLAAFAVCGAASIALAAGPSTPITAVLLLSLMYAAISVINTSIVTVYPLRYARSGSIASASGILDFAAYLGAGLGSAVYGFVIMAAGYEPMFVSWAAVSAISVLLLIPSWRSRSANTGDIC